MVNTREHFPNIQKSEVVRVQTFYYSIVVLFLNSFFISTIYFLKVMYVSNVLMFPKTERS